MISADQLNIAYSVGIALSAIMAIANIARFKSRGPAALVMGLACIAIGFTMWMAKEGASQTWVSVGIVATAVLLLIEFGLRAAKQGSRR